MTQLTPIARYTAPYISGLALSWTSNTTLTVASGHCSDSTNAIDMTIAAATLLNSAVVGINGLDTGTLAASTVYYIFVVGDSRGINPAGTLLSLSATTPTLPSGNPAIAANYGYDSFRRVGVAITDSSTHFLKAVQTGTGSARTYWYDSMVSVLSGGASATFAAVSLAAAVPPLANLPVTFYGSLTPNTAGDAASFRPTGSAATTVFDVTGVVAAKAQDAQFTLQSAIASGAAKIDYKLTSASDALSLSVLSYTDFV